MSQEDISRGSSSEENPMEQPFSVPNPPHQNRKSPANDLEKRLLTALDKRHGSILANDLAKAVGKKSKKEINSTLYNMEKRGWVRKVQHAPPKWLILPAGHGALSGVDNTTGGQTTRDHLGQKRGRGGGNQWQKRGRGPAGPFKSVRSHSSNNFENHGGRGSGYPVPGNYGPFGGNGFSDGSKWEPDPDQGNPPEDPQLRLETSFLNDQHVSGGGERKTFDTTTEPMDIAPSVTSSEPSGNATEEPWRMHGFGRGIAVPERNDSQPLAKPGAHDRHSYNAENRLQYSSNFTAPREVSGEATALQLPAFPHQLLGNPNQRTSSSFPQTQGFINPGMGRGMGKLIMSNTRLACSFDQPSTRADNSGSDVSGEINLDEKILSQLSSGRTFSTADLAKAVLGKGALTRDINPNLYKLEKVGLVCKVQGHPPMWCGAGNQVGKSPSTQEETTIQSTSSNPQDWVPPAPHSLLPSGNQGDVLYQEPMDNSPAQQMPPPSSSLTSVRASTGNISEMMKLMNKNPISAFMEFGQSVQQQPVLEMVNQSGPSHKPKFTFVARVGRRKFPPVVTQNKKEGRREAAEAALRTLAAEGAFQMSPAMSKSSEPGFSGSTFFDRIASLAHQTFNNLAVDIPECFSGKKVIAALVMKVDINDDGRVISLGTGNRCVTGDKLSLEGQAVHDSHAEVITRRAFMRYMYRQLKIYRTNPEKTILTPSPSGKLTVREGCTFHLYISTAPCGDGAQFSWTDNQGNEEGPKADLNFSGSAQHCPTQEKNIQGLLRTKMELGEGTIPIQEKLPIQTWDAILQNQQRLRTMSCSDKVCRWNILGLQGSLLSNFIEPVYLSSLTLGALYHHGHLARAVCCRMDHCLSLIREMGDTLPLGYRVNHPQLGHVTSPDPPRGTEKTKEFSVNWFAGCDNAEVTDGTVGRIKGVIPSRLCKMNLLKEFMEVSALYGKPLPEYADTYNQIKLTADDFQKAKMFMKTLFRKGKAGTWVEKPVEVGMFPP